MALEDQANKAFGNCGTSVPDSFLAASFFSRVNVRIFSVDAVAEPAPPIPATCRDRTATQPIAAGVVSTVVIAVARTEIDAHATVARVPLTSAIIAATFATSACRPIAVTAAAPRDAAIATLAATATSYRSAFTAAAAIDRTATATAVTRTPAAARAGTATFPAAAPAGTTAAATARSATAATSLTSSSAANSLNLSDQGVCGRTRRSARTSGLRGRHGNAK